MGDGGKGSSPRPYSVPKDTFDANWDAIFGNKGKKPEKTLDKPAEKTDNSNNTPA